MNRPVTILSLCAAAIVISGCAGYRLGPTNGDTAGARSVQINPIVNHTIEPRLGDYLTMSLRQNLQRDGTYQVNTHNDGDIILNAVITNYQRLELTVSAADAITPLDYEIIATAQVTAKERSSGKILFDRPVTGQTILRAGNDLPSSERQAIPMLTDELARKATALLVDGKW
jgi:hypothetical protein